MEEGQLLACHENKGEEFEVRTHPMLETVALALQPKSRPNGLRLSDFGLGALGPHRQQYQL
jgi:hypothetical protein